MNSDEAPMDLTLAPYRPVDATLQRLGRQSDGGYVVPSLAVQRARTLVSIGIGSDLTFDAAFLRQNPSARLIALDGTVSLGSLVAQAGRIPLRVGYDAIARRSPAGGVRGLVGLPVVVGSAVMFVRLGSSPRSSFIRKNVGVEDSAHSVTLDSVVEWYPPPGGSDSSAAAMDMFLKLDIEGGQYGIIPQVIKSAHRFAGLVIEWHNLEQRWLDFRDAMSSLLEDFAVVHIHGNNNRATIPGTSIPGVLEVSMLSRRMLADTTPMSTRRYPVPGLDFPNNPRNHELPLDFR